MADDDREALEHARHAPLRALAAAQQELSDGGRCEPPPATERGQRLEKKRYAASESGREPASYARTMRT